MKPVEEIHNSLLNGNRKQMAEEIDRYGLYDFFEDYMIFLNELYFDVNVVAAYFIDCTISYHRITYR